jgi:hypothetical protein
LGQGGANVAHGAQNVQRADVARRVDVTAHGGFLDQPMFLANVDRATRGDEHRNTPVAFVLIVNLCSKTERPARSARADEGFVKVPVTALVLVERSVRAIRQRLFRAREQVVRADDGGVPRRVLVLHAVAERENFERDAMLGNVVGIGLRNRRDAEAALCDRVDEARFDQPRECLAQRRCAEAVPVAQPLDAQARAGGKPPVNDIRAQDAEGALVERGPGIAYLGPKFVVQGTQN